MVRFQRPQAFHSSVWRRKDCCVLSSRLFSTESTSRKGEQLRVAVVGGGAAGLSAALHLAPLVESGCLASPIDVYDAGRPRRSIGVGIWSSAIDPFHQNPRISHQMAYNLMTDNGSWLGDVGYRTPSGAWLMKSHLPVSESESATTSMPALLFLREHDMLDALRKAVHWEEHQGTIQVHSEGNKTRVMGVEEDAAQPWSARLLLANDRLSETDYHLIIAADGTHSVLRQMYGGHQSHSRILTGAGALPSPIDLPSQQSTNMDSAWNESQQREAVGLQDRKYTVFRGNSPLSSADIRDESLQQGVSFQTWGMGRSMRFATVPMRYPGSMQTTEERQVWFITIDDDEIVGEPDPLRRRTMLLEAFADWHDPIRKIVEATPPDEILMERAIAHSHSLGPVLNFNRVVEQMRGVRPPNSGKGPCIIYLGDAYMTVDPILAQGFTVAMEGAYDLRASVSAACVPSKNNSTAFDPQRLRKELKTRGDKRIDRIICLLRVTELVQALGQPSGGTLSGAINMKLLRPLTRLIPNFVKKPIFDAVLKYSLGLLGKRKSA